MVPSGKRGRYSRIYGGGGSGGSGGGALQDAAGGDDGSVVTAWGPSVSSTAVVTSGLSASGVNKGKGKRTDCGRECHECGKAFEQVQESKRIRLKINVKGFISTVKREAHTDLGARLLNAIFRGLGTISTLYVPVADMGVLEEVVAVETKPWKRLLLAWDQDDDSVPLDDL